MRRGDLVAVVLPDAPGKPRPGLVVRHDAFAALASVTILPLTSDVRGLPLVRVPVAPGSATGLGVASEIQIDKITTVPRDNVQRTLGALDDNALQRVDEALRRFLGLGWGAAT
jgi:mRNA interferase MazF